MKTRPDEFDILFVRVPPAEKVKFKVACERARITMGAGAVAILRLANKLVESDPLFFAKLMHKQEGEAIKMRETVSESAD